MLLEALPLSQWLKLLCLINVIQVKRIGQLFPDDYKQFNPFASLFRISIIAIRLKTVVVRSVTARLEQHPSTMLNSSLFAQHVSDSRRTYSYIAHSIVPPIHLSISEYTRVPFFVQQYRGKKQQKEKLREKLQRSAVTLIFNSPCKIVVLISATLAKLIITENKYLCCFQSSLKTQ